MTLRLQPEADREPAALAPMFMAAIEGLYLLKAIGRDGLANLAIIELAARLR